MLVIRLQRTGRSNLATYRIVVAEKARPARGKFLEIVGHYLPSQGEGVFEANQDRIAHWVKHGAFPSDTVARLLKKAGHPGMEPFIVRYAKRRSKNAPPEEPTIAASPVTASEQAQAAVDSPVSVSESVTASASSAEPDTDTRDKA